MYWTGFLTADFTDCADKEFLPSVSAVKSAVIPLFKMSCGSPSQRMYRNSSGKEEETAENADERRSDPRRSASSAVKISVERPFGTPSQGL